MNNTPTLIQVLERGFKMLPSTLETSQQSLKPFQLIRNVADLRGHLLQETLIR
jgi:hypothetical protein